MAGLRIADLSDEVLHELGARAASSGQSLADDVSALLTTHASRRSVDQVLARARERVAATGSSVGVEDIVGNRTADHR